MINIEHVTKKYGEVVAVNDLSLTVGGGEVCVVIGPSGCGKTTTLRMINRLVEPSAGHILINGHDINGLKPEHLRRSIGYAIQSVGLFPHLTVAANVAVVPQLLGWDKTRTSRRVDDLLEMVGLNPADYRGKFPHQLSGGEAQRVGVARALAADPEILLMDEPFGAVDPLTRERLQAQFLRIQGQLKKTVMFVTHDLDEAVRLADRIAIMESGRLVQYDTPETVLSKPANKFVHDFVGTDRALKRLLRISVTGFIKPALSVTIDMSVADVLAADSHRWFWVVDGENHLLGWIDRVTLSPDRSLKEAVTTGDIKEFAISDRSTLREALSRMLGQGFKFIPVVDDSRRLVGEISLKDIEAATAENGVTRHE